MSEAHSLGSLVSLVIVAGKKKSFLALGGQAEVVRLS